MKQYRFHGHASKLILEHITGQLSHYAPRYDTYVNKFAGESCRFVLSMYDFVVSLLTFSGGIEMDH